MIVQHYGQAYPELRRHEQRVADVIREEEESFGRTLERGIRRFEELAEQAQGTIEGQAAFQLYDTFGFPLDLTQVMAQERGLAVDVEGFERAMARQRAQSRAGAKGQQRDDMALDAQAIDRLRALGVAPPRGRRQVPRPGDQGPASGRSGTGGTSTRAPGPRAGPSRWAWCSMRPTSTPQAGGQLADHGRMFVSREDRSSVRDAHDGGELRVQDVRAFGGYVLHVGHVVRGELRVGDEVNLVIDAGRRQALAANHTATHLFNLALRQVAGQTHAPEQRGSLVAPDRLRFDFDAPGPVDPADLGRIESLVRSWVERDAPVYADLVPQQQAMGIAGLRAVFGEKYPDPVRVVSIGVPIEQLLERPDDPRWMEVSVELCGGTHLPTTAGIESFAIVHEEGVAKGIRRIVALTRQEARKAIAQANALASELQQAADLPDEKLPQAVASLARQIDEAVVPVSRKAELRQALAQLQERLKQARKALARQATQAALAQAKALAESTGDGNPLVAILDQARGDRSAMQAAMARIRQGLPDSPVLLLSTDEDGKVAILAEVPPIAQQRGLHAGQWVRQVAQVVGGKGGGRPDQAQGGGTDARPDPSRRRQGRRTGPGLDGLKLLRADGP
ncbi:MAG: hypothetical protein KatS3mg103_0780 [Phycisphaerales bacterium]|nr:MAG: hypothetical protein KatS3mg103_0780 [Phycisphaerales bacterium]